MEVHCYQKASGRTVTLDIGGDEKAGSLKTRVAEELRVPVVETVLRIANETPADDTPLSELSLENGDTVTVERSFALLEPFLSATSLGDRMFDEARLDRSFVLAAARLDGRNMRVAPEEFKADEEIALAAVAQNGFAIADVAEELRGNRGVVLVASLTNPKLLDTCPLFAGDAEIVGNVVSRNAGALQNASEELRNNVVECAKFVVRTMGFAFRYCGEVCRGDKGVVLEAVRLRGENLRHASAALQQDREVVMAAVGHTDQDSLKHVVPPLSTDIDVVLSALQNNKHNARFVRYSVAGVSKPVALAVVTAAPQLLGSIPAPMCDDRDVVRAAVTADALALRYASDAVRGDTAFVASLTSTSCMPLRYAGPAVTDNVAFMTAALTRDSTAIFYAGTTVRSDPSFCLAAVRLRGSNLSLCSQHIREDLDIVRAAVTADPNAIRHAADSVRSREEFATLALLTSRDNA